MTKLDPFADDAASISIGKLTFENGTDQVTIYGSLEIRPDQTGLAYAARTRFIPKALLPLFESVTWPLGRG